MPIGQPSDVVLHPELRVLDAFAGYGGFSLGLQIAGVAARTVAYIERDSHAAATLVARMEDAALDRAPVWSDIGSFDGRPWNGRVDLVTGGFPCQPWSAAGQKRGLDDDRWLWPHIARVITEVGPSLVFLENVPGLNRGIDGGGFSFVLQDLADLGFDAEWGLLSAASVGATHRRERLWILAVAHDHLDRLETIRGQVLRGSIGYEHSWDDTDGSGSAVVGDAGSSGRQQEPGGSSGDEGADGRGAQGGDLAHSPEQDVGNSTSEGRLGGNAERELPRLQSAQTKQYVADAPSVDEREPHHGTRSVPWRYARDDFGWSSSFPPKPDDEEGWQRWISAGGPEPSLRRVPDGSTGRLVKPDGLADQLHILGNGLVPLAAAHAFLQLSERLLSGRSG